METKDKNDYTVWSEIIARGKCISYISLNRTSIFYNQSSYYQHLNVTEGLAFENIVCEMVAILPWGDKLRTGNGILVHLNGVSRPTAGHY